jgi:large subunit ribosomal protein L25
MTQRATLMVEHREMTGKAVKALRRQGLIPGNLYGKDRPSQPVQIDGHELSKFLATHGPTTLIELHVDGNKSDTVMIQEIQREAVSRAIQHVDFLQIVMTKPIRMHVPIRIEGEAPAVARENGMLLQVLENVEIEALPTALPQSLSLDISDMEELKSIRHVSDLLIPSDVTLLTSGDEVVLKIEPPRTLEVPAEPTAEAQAPTAEQSQEEPVAEPSVEE